MVIKLLPIYSSMAPLLLDNDQQSNRIEVGRGFCSEIWSRTRSLLMTGFTDIYGSFWFDSIKVALKKCHMDFILKSGQFSMFKIVLNLKCCLRDDRILKVTFKQNLLKRDLPSELGYFNISDQNYTLIHLSTKLLFESQAGLCKCYNWIYKSICDLSMCKFKIYILLIAKCLKHVKFMKHLYCLKT